MTSRQPTTSSASAGPSRTLTLTSPPAPPAETDGLLRLRPEPSSSRPAPSRRVVWTDETVDNEGMGRKKSKICCIYHKPKAFDESSDESSSDGGDNSDSGTSDSGSDSSDDGPSVSKALKEKLKQREGHGHAEHEGHEGCIGRKSRHKATARVRSSAGTQTITEEAESGGRDGKEESDAEDEGREFRPNAYERGTR
ncbi:hypothetical protein PHSY_004051 [Pseudozyma hubeiensis SY62]|uniref:Type 1 phosphatases regulator n=1 Tax=Pseudozyma hubeiensis (strain SY62) TaxID=1305764 RepID=R9P534_PSEHS|nr:hypothetical protein PHSY_004051 [Pseudozyma hubeiensis SY62]GAC96471.1 hypothetical protein PHSY_004051 [Pseudozyma hubeiensis SY62]